MANSDKWIYDEPKWIDIPFWIIKGIIAVYLIATFGVIIAYIFSIEIPDNIETIKLIEALDQKSFIVILLIMGLLEEIFFRFIPIMIGMNVFNNMKLAILLCIISSVIFGYIHGSIANLLVQGFIGMAFSILYLKFGASNRKIFKPLLATSLVHSLYNMALITIS